MTEEELKHWGVLGMKWGRRKAKRQINEHKDSFICFYDACKIYLLVSFWLKGIEII